MVDHIGRYAALLCLESCNAVQVHENSTGCLSIRFRIQRIDNLLTHGITTRTYGWPHAHMNLPCTSCTHKINGLPDDIECQSTPAGMDRCNQWRIIGPQEDRYAIGCPDAKDKRRVMGNSAIGLGKRAGGYILGPYDHVGMDLLETNDTAVREKPPEHLRYLLRAPVQIFCHRFRTEYAMHQSAITYRAESDKDQTKVLLLDIAPPYM